MTFIDQASKEFNMEPPLCEHTIRKCIEALPKQDMIGIIIRSREALEALLPKKNRAKELVEEWGQCPTYPDPGTPVVLEDFANWLINEKGAL